MAVRSRQQSSGAARTPPRIDDSDPGPPFVRSDWFAVAGLLLLCLAIYANAFQTGFALDNRQLILRDARVHSLTRENLGLIFGHTYWWPYGESGLYRPLATLSYLFNFAVLGNADRAAGYHWFNLIVHGTNVLLLWLLLRRVTASRWASAAGAALWAAAPLSTEAVTSIVGRADLMAATGALAAMVLYLHGRERSGAARVAWMIGVAISITLGTMAKESAVAVLALVAVYELLYWSSGRSLATLMTAAAAAVVPLGWWAWQRATVLAVSTAAEFPFTDNPIVGATFWQGRLTAVQVMWRYMTLMAWPAHLSNDYSYAQIPLASGTAAEWVGVLLLVGGIVAALFQARAHRDVLFFTALSLITFLPASNLLFATGTIMGERLVYLPSAGLAALVAVALGRVARTPARRRAATAIVCVLVAACGARAFARNRDWSDDVTLWRSAVGSVPASAKAHWALAEAIYDSDPTRARIDEVIAESDRAVALLEPLPDEQNAYQAFRQAGAYYLDKAGVLSTASNDSTSPELRRVYSRALNLLDRAVVIARAGASRLPGGSVEPEADAQRLRAAAMLGLENPSLALNAATRARALSPLNPLGYHLSAAALMEMTRPDEAVMTLMAGSMVSGDPGLGREAMALYQAGVDPAGCAVIGSGPNAALNQECPTVVRHSCIASAAAYQILQKAGQAARATQTKEAAISSLGCPADLMDRTNSLVP